MLKLWSFSSVTRAKLLSYLWYKGQLCTKKICPVHSMLPLFHFSVYFYSSRSNPHEPPFHLHWAHGLTWYILLIGHIFNSNGHTNMLSALLRGLILLYLAAWITTSHSICCPWPIYKRWCCHSLLYILSQKSIVDFLTNW